MGVIVHRLTRRSTAVAGAALVSVAAVGTWAGTAHGGAADNESRAVASTVSAALVADQQVGALYPGGSSGERSTTAEMADLDRRARHWLTHPAVARRASAASVARLERTFAGSVLDHELAAQRGADATYRRFVARFHRTGALATNGTSFTADGGATDIEFDAIDVAGSSAHVTGSATVWVQTDVFEPSGVIAYSPSRRAAVDARLERDAAGEWRVVSLTVQPSGL